jgi:hypothetical protein
MQSSADDRSGRVAFAEDQARAQVPRAGDDADHAVSADAGNGE